MRITSAMIDNLAQILCRHLGRPDTSYTRTGDVFTANVGNIHVDVAFNNVYTVCEMINDGGGVLTLSEGLTAREAYQFLCGMMAACRIVNEK